MLQKMREQARGVFGKIIIGSIVLVMAVFGFGALNFFVTSEPAVAKVGDAEILQSELLAQIDRQRRQILASMGPSADPSQIDEAALRENVLSGLIARTLLLEGARQAHMGSPEPVLDDVIIDTPEFQVDGRFDEDRFRLVLSSAGMNPVTFREALGDDLVVNQLSAGIRDTGFATDHEFASMAALMRQERDIAWLLFDPADFRADVSVDEDAVLEYYDTHPADYRAPEQVSVEYVELDRASLAADVTVSDEDIEQAYETEVAAFEGQEQRGAAHILLTTGDDRSEADAIALAQSLSERVEAGESFAELAEEYSDDPGSAAQGGDLGMATRGTFVPEFERALFAMEEGELSEPVVTEFGVHLIRLGEIARTEAPSLARLRPTLVSRIRQRAAQAKFDELRATLETVAYEAPDLQEPAQRLGLEVRTAGPLTRAGGEGVFANPAVVDAAFTADVLDSGYNSPVLEAQDGLLVVLRVVDHVPERLQPFEEVAQRVREDLISERARALASAAADAAAEALETGASATAVAAEAGREWTRRDGLQRTERDVPSSIVRESFRLPYPVDDARSVGRTEVASGAIAVVTVTTVRPGDLAALTDAERSQFEQLVRRRVGSSEFEVYRNALRRDLGVSRRIGEAAEAG